MVALLPLSGTEMLFLGSWPMDYILMVDSLGYDKNYWIVFLAKYLFISKKYANYQSPLISSFDAPFY